MTLHAWASRTHFSLKAVAGERLDGPSFKLRECGDYRNVNTQLVKTDMSQHVKCVHVHDSTVRRQ